MRPYVTNLAMRRHQTTSHATEVQGRVSQGSVFASDFQHVSLLQSSFFLCIFCESGKETKKSALLTRHVSQRRLFASEYASRSHIPVHVLLRNSVYMWWWST